MSSAMRTLGLPQPIADALEELNATQPTPVQAQVIPWQLAHPTSSLSFTAPTGSGKTLAYLAPLVHLLKLDEKHRGLLPGQMGSQHKRPRALVIVPNRELGSQVASVLKTLCHHAKISGTKALGGDNRRVQRKSLAMTNDVVIGTVGRLLQHRDAKNLLLGSVQHLIIDEADTMLGQGFLDDLKLLCAPMFARNDLRLVMTSATAPNELKRVHRTLELHEPVHQVLVSGTHHLNPDVRFDFQPVTYDNKNQRLVALLAQNAHRKTIIFCNTVDSARALDHTLSDAGLATTCIHGQIPPRARSKIWDDYQRGNNHILVTTDILSRGLDTTHVDHVVMYDFPRDMVDFLHRAGRTGRAGASGLVSSLVKPSDRRTQRDIQNALNNGLALHLTGPDDHYRRNPPRDSPSAPPNRRPTNIYRDSSHKHTSSRRPRRDFDDHNGPRTPRTDRDSSPGHRRSSRPPHPRSSSPSSSDFSHSSSHSSRPRRRSRPRDNDGPRAPRNENDSRSSPSPRNRSPRPPRRRSFSPSSSPSSSSTHRPRSRSSSSSSNRPRSRFSSSSSSSSSSSFRSSQRPPGPRRSSRPSRRPSNNKHSTRRP